MAQAVTLPPHIRKPGRPRPPRKPIGLSKRVKAALELMVFGSADGPDAGRPLTRAQAAATVGLADNSLYIAIRNPEVRKHLHHLEDVLKTSERPRAFRRIVDLAHGAESEKVSLDAAKYIDSGGKADGTTVNVNVGVSLQPGYQVRIPEGMIDVTPGHQPSGLLTQAANTLIPQADVPTREKGTP